MTGGDLLQPPHPAPRGVSQHPEGFYRAECTGRVPLKIPGAHGVAALSHAPQTMGVTRGGCICLPPIPPPGPMGWVDVRVLSLPLHRILQGECRCPSHPKPQGLGAFCPPHTTVSHGVRTCVTLPLKLQGAMNLEAHVAPAPPNYRV